MPEVPTAKPLLVVLGGINGAGKSTAATELIGKSDPPLIFVNADQIARGLNGFFPETAAFEAGRIQLQWLETLRQRQANFSVETTLSGRSYIPFIKKLRSEGYRVLLHYLWLGSADLAISRVKYRVSQGGHDIPIDTIRQRYLKSLNLFWKDYSKIVDKWILYDNSVSHLHRIASGGLAEPLQTTDNERWSVFVKEVEDDVH